MALAMAVTSSVYGFSVSPRSTVRTDTSLWVKRDPMRMPSQTPMVPYKVRYYGGYVSSGGHSALVKPLTYFLVIVTIP